MQFCLEVKNITHHFKSQILFSSLSFLVKKDEAVALIGPSGCGKSTLLRILAGILQPTEGQVIRQPNNDNNKQSNLLGFVFQDPTLLPWLTVSQNILLPKQLLKRTHEGPRLQSVNEFVDQLIHRVGLGSHKEKYPHELSGGMRMRTSLVRALSIQPQLLFLDEPFTALDEEIKEKIISDFQSLQAELHLTTVIVTHSLTEALLLSDRVLVLGDDGSLRFEFKNKINRFQKDIQFKSEFQAELLELRSKVRANSFPLEREQHE